jgi:hypothetical protein
MVHLVGGWALGAEICAVLLVATYPGIDKLTVLLA